MIEIDDLRRGLNQIATEVEPVDLRDQALATSRRIRNRRAATGVVAGLAVVAVAVGAAVGLRTDRTPTLPAVDPTPAVTALPTERPDAGPDLGPLASATITVPSWGSNAGCSTGRVTFKDGQHKSINILSYAAVDVDHDGTLDEVVHLSCGEGPEAGGSQIVAFRHSGKEFLPIGRVVGTQDGLAMMDEMEARDGGRVAVLVSKQYSDGGQNQVPNQWRTYAWQAGKFRQVAGPTSFPAKPPAALLSVVPTALAFQPAGGGYTGRMTVTVRNDGAVDVARMQLLLILPSQVRPAGAGWDGCVVRDGEDDDTALVCTVAGPRAHGHSSTSFTVSATEKPEPIDDPVNLGNHYVSISQAPPFDGLVTIDNPDVIIPISVP